MPEIADTISVSGLGGGMNVQLFSNHSQPKLAVRSRLMPCGGNTAEF